MFQKTGDSDSASFISHNLSVLRVLSLSWLALIVPSWEGHVRG